MKANTVRNDMVEASSEAELSTSERGMGLGIDVVGGGDAEVSLKTRAGWHFANGSTQETVYKTAGRKAMSSPIESDNRGAESGGKIEIGETDDPPEDPPTPEEPENKEEPDPEDPPGSEDEDPSSEDKPLEHDSPVLDLVIDSGNRNTATAVARSVLDTDGYMTFKATLKASVKKKGIHDKGGKEKEFSPTKYHWSWSEDGVKGTGGSCETEGPSATVSVQLSKASKETDRKVTFTVYGTGCEHCSEKVSTEECSAAHSITVYVLAIERKDYLGVNRTDEYWSMNKEGGYEKCSKQTAELKITPKPKVPYALRWKQVGENYEFTDRFAVSKDGASVQSQERVEYRNKTPDSHSSKHLGDVLTANVAIDGMTEAISCSTNFTIVKVDAKIDDIDEALEEGQGAVIPNSYVAYKNKGLLDANKKVLTVSVAPALPADETLVVLPSGVVLYPKGAVSDAHGAKIALLDKRTTIRMGGATTFVFDVWGIKNTGKLNDSSVLVEHVNWSDLSSMAQDRVNLTCYGFEIVTPAGDPVKEPNDGTADDGTTGNDGQNEFTYRDRDSAYDNKGVLRVYLKAKLVPAVKGSYSGKFAVSDIDGASLVWKKIKNSRCEVTSKGVVKADDNGVFEAVAVFVGYPSKNNAFGLKNASFTLDGVTKKAPYEVFFPKSGKNHPECSRCPGCPNWFYYWRQGACKMEDYVYYGGYKEDMYGAAFVGKLSLYKKAEEVLGKDAAEDILKPGQLVALYDLSAGNEQEIKIPTPGWARKPEDKKRYAGRKVGGLRGGLACCAAIVTHEQHHVDMSKKFNGLKDADEDQVADDLEDLDKNPEDGIRTRTDKPDSYNVAGKINPMYAKYGDNEIRARKVEREGVSYDKSQDWSNPGFQCKDHSGSYDHVKEDTK